MKLRLTRKNATNATSHGRRPNGTGRRGRVVSVRWINRTVDQLSSELSGGAASSLAPGSLSDLASFSNEFERDR
jgi:hypothetical protein